MNTTELRGIADALEIDCIAWCADEIDRLTREAVAADIRISNDSLMIAGLTAERDALRADAERYRWLMSNKKDFACCVYDEDGDGYGAYYAVDQVQIDAAMKGQP